MGPFRVSKRTFPNYTARCKMKTTLGYLSITAVSISGSVNDKQNTKHTTHNTKRHSPISTLHATPHPATLTPTFCIHMQHAACSLPIALARQLKRPAFQHHMLPCAGLELVNKLLAAVTYDCLCCCSTSGTSNCNFCLRHLSAVYKITYTQQIRCYLQIPSISMVTEQVY